MASQAKKYISWQFYLLQLPFWSALVLLVMATLLILVIRFLVPQIDSLRPHLETWLDENLPFEVEISHLSGSLFKIDPAIGIDKLTLSNHGHEFLVIEDVYFELDTLASLIAGAPRMKDARLAGLELWMEETPQGWQLKGWQAPQRAKESPHIMAVEDHLKQVMDFVEQLLVQGELNFADLKFNFIPLDDDALFFSADAMSYRRWSRGRQFAFQLETSKVDTQAAELVITLEGENFNAKTSQLSAWFNLPLVKLDDFQSLWPTPWQDATQNLQGQFSVEGWLNLNEGVTRLDLQAKNVELVRSKLWQIEFDTADITLQGTLDAWSADWKVTHLNASEYFFDALSGRVGQEEQQSYLQLEDLDLGVLAGYIEKDDHLPTNIRELIKDLAPAGHLKNLFITRDSQGEYELQANLQEVKVAAWEGAPLGRGLQGWLQVDAKGGQVVFSEQPLQLGFPELYTQVWHFSKAKGVVSWELEGDDLWVIGEDLAVVLPLDTVTNKEIYVSGDFAYFYGAKDQRFYLNLGLLSADALSHHQLVPDKLLDPALLDWLNSALLAGKVSQAGFIYAGSIKHKAAFQLVTDFSATDFKFQPDWPPLSQASGQVQVLDGRVKGQVASAQLGIGQLNQASFATNTAAEGEVELQVRSGLSTDLEFFPWLVSNSPLKSQVPEPLHDWLYSGQLQGDLNLLVPLTATEQTPQVSLTTQISDAQLTLSQIDLAVTDIQGPLNFSLEKGLESKGLIGKVMGETLEAKFLTEPENYLKFTAGLAAEAIKHYFNLPAALDLTGKSSIQGGMPLAPFGVLEVTSDLQGLALNTPLPWNKEALEARLLKVELDFSALELPLKVQLADQADFLMHLQEPSRGSHLQLAVNKVAKAVLPEEAGLAIKVAINQLNAEAVYLWYQQLSLNLANADLLKEQMMTAPVDALEGLSSFNIKVADLSWNDLSLGSLDLGLQNLNQGLRLDFSAANSAGEIWWPISPEEQLIVTLNHLSIPEKPNKTVVDKGLLKRASWPEIKDPLLGYSFHALPETLMIIESLKLGNKKLGKVTTQMSALDNGIRLNPLQIDLEQSHLMARLDWLSNELESSTFIEGSLTGKNLAPGLKALTAEKEAPIVSGQHQLTFATHWQGSPLAFDLLTAQAEFQLELNDGYFPQTDLGLSGVSQLFGLLNMDTLLRRLRLDFSDLTAKGVSYNSIKGKYRLQEGYLLTNEPTKVVSSATRMTLTGQVDLIEETLEQELAIVLPVAQSLPLAAVLVGAPQVGAAIWAVQKIFSNLFDNFTEARYQVSGSMSDPKVELQRVF